MLKPSTRLIALILLLCGIGTVSHAADTPLGTVTGEYRTTIRLNGTWETLPIHGVTFSYPPPETGWTPDTVPSANPRSLSTPMGAYRPRVVDTITPDGKGFKRQDGIAAWFRRSFTLPGDIASGRRIVLHFGGMAFRSKTWLNGRPLGESVIGQIPQDYDVTDIIKPGQSNTLVVGIAGREAIIDLATKSYIAPASGVVTGIWGDVSLDIVPETRIDDIFVSTSVRQKRLSVAATLVDSLPGSRQVQIDGLVMDDSGETQCLLAPQTVTLTPGGRTTVTLTRDWIAPKLWSPETPSLYFVRLRVRSGQTMLDERTQRFGFREFWIEGRDFYLNGRRTLLRRNSVLYPLMGGGEQGAQDFRLTAGRPFNTIRLHIGFDNAQLLDAADRYGLMTMPEVAWYGIGHDYPIEAASIWLPNLVAYERALIHMNRSHPAVIVWNLANECFWFSTEPANMKVADALVAAAVQEDPTRPQEGDGETTWGGRLPIINVHYPEWDAGDVRSKFPDSSFVAPNDLYWIKNAPTPSHGWRADFTWDRPLMIGEYWCLDGGPDEKSSFMGESAYDWEKWRWQDISGRDSLAPNAIVDMVKMTTDAYRIQGVAGLNPWSGNRQDVMPSVAVRPLDFHPNFYAGRTGTRKFALFTDAGSGLGALTLQCSLSVNGVIVWRNRIDVPRTGGKPAIVDVSFPCPRVSRATKAVLKVRLWESEVLAVSGTGPDLSHDIETVHILPAPRWSAPQPKDVVLYDPIGETAKALSSLGLSLAARASLRDADLTACRLLIVGREVDASPARAIIGKFVARGGHALLLSAKNINALTTELPKIDAKHAASRVWMRSHGVAAFGGLEEGQLSYWQPDNIVCQNTALKPSGGKYKILLDAGGLYGLKWTPLVEVSHGAGSLLISQLNLIDRVGVEPAADTLLLSLIRSERNASPSPRSAFRLLMGADPILKQALSACSVATTPGLHGEGPVLLDASYSPTVANIAALKAHLRRGGVLWLHGFTPATIARVAGLFPFTPRLVQADQTVLSAARRSDDPWMDGISSFDFAWTRVDLSARTDYFAGAKATAPIGQYELADSGRGAAVKLITPGFLYRVPVGKGAILMDTLAWDTALTSETERATRIATCLALNLGGDIVVLPPKAYRYITADISQVANRGYRDDVAGDGKGGWNDAGANDMRYFLINHTGKVGGMEVPTAAFPARADFAGRPFALVDPKRNDGKAVVVLQGVGHDPAALTKATGIKIGARADKLWFLNAGCWVSRTSTEEIARYVIHYADGTTEPFPIRGGIEIADWWSTVQPTAAKVGWSGRNDQHSPLIVYVTEWTNPHPEKEITTVDAVSAGTAAQLVLLGVTAGQELPTR